MHVLLFKLILLKIVLQRDQEKPWLTQAKTAIQSLEIGDTELVRILYWNCSHGITSKRSIVKSLLVKYRPKLAFISESEIKSNLNNNYNFYNMIGYDLHLANTISQGRSRIICYAEKGINFKRRTDLEPADLDIIIMENQDVRILGIYRPFILVESETRQETFEKLIKNLRQSAATSNQKAYVAGGDFNVDWGKESRMKTSLTDWMEDFDLKQIINTITRYRAVNTGDGLRNEASTLDHIYTNLNNTKVTQLPTAWSDHEFQILDLPFHVSNKRRMKIKMRDWRAYNPVKFADSVEAMCLERFVSTVKAAMEKKIPERVVRFREDKGQIADPAIAKVTKNETDF